MMAEQLSNQPPILTQELTGDQQFSVDEYNEPLCSHAYCVANYGIDASVVASVEAAGKDFFVLDMRDTYGRQSRGRHIMLQGEADRHAWYAGDYLVADDSFFVDNTRQGYQTLRSGEAPILVGAGDDPFIYKSSDRAPFMLGTNGNGGITIRNANPNTSVTVSYCEGRTPEYRESDLRPYPGTYGLDTAGLKAGKNKDRALFLPRLGFMTVIDGEDDPRKGDTAADIVHHTILTEASAPQAIHVSDVRAAMLGLRNTLQHASYAVRAKQQQGYAMGTAARLLDVDGQPHLAWASAGNTRAYVVSGDSVRQLTRDEGRGDDVNTYMGSNLAGNTGQVRQMSHLGLAKGDTVLLTTDGASGLTNDELMQVYKANPDPQMFATNLVRVGAQRRRDDRTALAVRVD